MNRSLLPFQGWRLIFFRAVALSLIGILIIRTWQLQFLEGASFRQDADENQFQTLPISATRGAIFDRYGNSLALNDPAWVVTVTPALLPDSREQTIEIYNQLSALVNVPATRAMALASNRSNQASIDELVTESEGIAPFRAVAIAVDVDKEIALEILERSQLMPGVGVETRAVRSYPSGMSTSHIIGYLGPIPENQAQALRELGLDPAFDRIGYAGIEAFFQTELAGKNGNETYQVDIAGRREALVSREEQLPGYSIRLTLDIDLQNQIQQILTTRLNTINAQEQRLRTQSGVVIAMNPQTGEILASVSWPTYDNSRFARSIDGGYYLNIAADPLRPLVNHAVQSLYPPGSIWKMITSVAVIDEGVIAPRQPLLDPGRLTLPNAYAPNDIAQSQTFVCWERSGHGPQSLVDAIANSCDVYFYQVGGGNPELGASVLRPGGLGVVNLYRWATAFGIGSRLGIELPGETAGTMPESQWKRRLYGESWSTGDTYNASFGQGYVTVTPLQLVNAIAAIVNDGTVYQPTLIRHFEDAEGNIVSVSDDNGKTLGSFTPQVARTLIPPANGEPWVLLLQEDMLLQKANSLACRCERNSDFYNPDACNPATYTSQFDRNPDPTIEEWVQYKVNVPFGYYWTANVCDPLSFDIVAPNYGVPPEASIESIEISQDGMRRVVTGGTASYYANPSYPPLTIVEEGGKTGTAEYCDDIAAPQGLCIPGRWPSHAWYVGYAPYDNPEIIVIAFLYNAGEGSANAMPVVRETLQYYFSRIPPQQVSTRLQ